MDIPKAATPIAQMIKGITRDLLMTFILQAMNNWADVEINDCV